MSRLEPALLVLDKGLNLQAPKIVAPPGTVYDSLNYEQVDFVGQKRIDGFSRYDGTKLATLDDFVILPPSTPTNIYGGRVFGVTNDSVWGVQVGLYEDDLVFAVLNENLIPTDAVYGSDAITDTEAHYELLLSYNTVLRDFVEQLPGAIIGLHWFRDRLYAVADLPVIEVISVNQEGSIPADEVPVAQQPQPGETVNGGEAQILVNSWPYLVLSGPVAAGNVILDDSYFISMDVDNMGAGISASFYESRTEEQVINEDGPAGPYDFGWRFNHLGWLVPFEEGNSQFGNLTSLNQNRQGVGVQGPTTVDGNNGRPLTLTQKVVISGKLPQVNGWKTSSSPASYNLEAGAVANLLDTQYIYADAFFSWDGTTGVVTAPGVNDPLTEYPATNTVEVEI